MRHGSFDARGPLPSPRRSDSTPPIAHEADAALLARNMEGVDEVRELRRPELLALDEPQRLLIAIVIAGKGEPALLARDREGADEVRELRAQSSLTSARRTDFTLHL